MGGGGGVYMCVCATPSQAQNTSLKPNGVRACVLAYASKRACVCILNPE